MAEALSERLIYTGTKQPQKNTQSVKTGQPLYPYLPSDDLVEAVNLSILLKRPLLLKGEPGCGKTRLAYAVAYELGLPIQAWYVKSTSRARDGLYNYDAVGRLRDAQLATTGRLSKEQITRIDRPQTYVRWGALGKAFQNPRPTVVLIDEIDKADIDFPNDLLLELDERRFIIEETGHEIRAKFPPLVFITSNDEKDLPDAFLRRCIFHFVEFPGQQRLVEILNQLFSDVSEPFLEKAVERFLALRSDMRKGRGTAGKLVSTSELIDWITVLQRYPEDEALAKLNGRLPFLGVLLKNWEDHQRYLAQLTSR